MYKPAHLYQQEPILRKRDLLYIPLLGFGMVAAGALGRTTSQDAPPPPKPAVCKANPQSWEPLPATMSAASIAKYIAVDVALVSRAQVGYLTECDPAIGEGTQLAGVIGKVTNTPAGISSRCLLVDQTDVLDNPGGKYTVIAAICPATS